MRRVTKNINEPRSFSAWKNLVSEQWTPTYLNLQNPEKLELHIALLEEQGRTCCYCGREIGLDNSHIEHFRPQQTYRDLALSYENLFASCIRETSPGSPLHCGHLKDNWFDETFHLSPLHEDCDRQFSYTLDGQITPHTQASTTMTTVLGLDSPSLANRRREALAGVFDENFLLDATHLELRQISMGFRQRSSGGDHVSFFQVVARYAEQMMAGGKEAAPTND